MNIRDTHTHVRGESIFVDDLVELEGTTHATLFTAPYAHGRITKLDFSKALELEGVIKIITAKDITGANQIGSFLRISL